VYLRLSAAKKNGWKIPPQYDLPDLPWLNPLRCDSVNLTRRAVTSELHRVGKKGAKVGDVEDRLFGSLQVDSSKARDLLGWKPVVSMNEALKRTAETYLEE